MRRKNHRRRWGWWLIGTLAVLTLVLGTWGVMRSSTNSEDVAEPNTAAPKKAKKKTADKKEKSGPTKPRRQITNQQTLVLHRQPITKGPQLLLLVVLTIALQTVLAPRPLLVRERQMATPVIKPIMICPTMTLPARPPKPRWAPSSITWWLSSTSWPASTRNTRTLPPSTAASPAFRRAIIS